MKTNKIKKQVSSEEWNKRFDIAYNQIKIYFSLKEIEEMIEKRILEYEPNPKQPNP